MSNPVQKPADGTFKGKNGEHDNAAYEGEETNPNLSSSDTSNASSEPYVSFSADQLAYIRRHGSNQEINSPTSSINSNPDKNNVTKEKCMTKPGIHAPSNENVDDPTYIRDSGSYQDMNTPTSSINSNPGKIDVTTEKFMTKPGIHVPFNENDFPHFNNINVKVDLFRRQKTNDISWKDSLTWPDVVRPPLGEVPSSNFKGNNNTGRFGTNGEIEEERDPLPITHSPFTYNNPVDRNTLNYEKEEESQSHEVFDFHDPVYFPSFPDNISLGSHYVFDFHDPVYCPSFPDNISLGSHYDLKSKKNCHWRKWFVFVFICLCASGVAAWIVQKEYGSKKETTDDPPTPSLVVDKCENDISTATVGEQICIPYTQQFTSNPSGIQVKQVSSQYFSALPSFFINVSSDTVSKKTADWIINFNISRPDQQLRFMKENATCDSIGVYEITIEYDDGNVTSFKFEISFKDPQLEQSVTRLNDKVFVHCEMKKTCMASSLALFVNDGGSSRLIPDIDVCSFTDKNSGTTVSADAIIHVSQLSENHTISCVPLMTNMELSANLTSTSGIPLCEGDCVPDCKDDPQGEAYFPDKNDCTQFYQCSNGQLVSQSCSPSTYWSTRKCTCLHLDDEICNRDTNRFLSPLLSIEKCTNASFV